MAVLIQIQDAERKKIVRGQATQKQHATDAIMATHEVAVAQLKAKQKLELEAQWARQRRGRDAAISFQNAKDALIMEQAQRRDDAFLFPAATVTADTPHLHPRSASKALEKVCRALEIEGGSMHCFRRTLATRMGDMGVPGDVISRILNHAPRDVTSRHYNHARMMSQMREALEQWEAHILEHVEKADTA